MSWSTIAFAPAPPGWGVIWQDKHTGEALVTVAQPIAGWLTQTERGTRRNRVIAAVEDGSGELLPVGEAADGGDLGFAILGPSDPATKGGAPE